MASDEPIPHRCGAKVTDNETGDVLGYCESFPMPNGRCWRHGGLSTGPEKGTANNMKHGVYAQRDVYYKNLEPEEQAWVDACFDSLIDDAPFDRTDLAKVEVLRSICIDLHKKRRGNAYVAEEGLYKEVPAVNQEGIPIRDPDTGEVVKVAQENALNLALDRLDRTIMKKMKDLGLLDDPQSKDAKAKESLARALAGLDLDTDDE